MASGVDSRCPLLKAHHQLLWTPDVRADPGKRLTFGSDAITNSYAEWGKPRALEAKAELSEEQKHRYLNPPFRIGSAVIWPVRKIRRPTLNTARGMRLPIADRLDLTLECSRRHYAEEPGSSLADVTTNYRLPVHSLFS
ncbi:DUF6994 family protein [Arthrobacter sp. SLBN-112]|jgi:hypothetical protein|uniref:DUF6994 family protein n=1 Tax=Arthrobacter sp. SLBN-112 TaxID=2768452 RepID=UPI003FA457A8